MSYKKLLIYIAVVLIYFAFLPALVLVWLSMFKHLISWNPKKIAMVFNAMNRLVSTLFGGDGTRSTSHTCGVLIHNGKADWRCKLLCKVLSKFDPDHCRKEAADEIVKLDSSDRIGE